MTRVAVVCVKWGTAYAPDYVNALYRAVRANMQQPHRFVCITDDATGLAPGIVAMPFPAFSVPREEWKKTTNLAKIAATAPGLLDDDEIVLQIDLDTMILGGLDDFIELYRRAPAMYTLREWNPALVRALLPQALWPDRGTQGSVYLFRAGEQRHMFALFNARILATLARYQTDRFAYPALAWNPRYLPYDWCLSFKNHCLWYWPLSLVAGEPRMPRTKVLCFHGRPRPTDLMQAPGVRWGTARKYGTQPVGWVGEYWARYSREK
ncbi:MAG: hypothetical protein MUC69_02630 [Gemmatimonadales bacterium]|nr:hypothetical protein [Gemmatimonadales bacterium]